MWDDCCYSAVKSCPTLCEPLDCSTPGSFLLYCFPVCSDSCPWVDDACHPAISSSVIPFASYLQSFPSIRVFPKDSILCIRWPEYWSFSFSVSPSSEYSGLISFRIDWIDLLSVHRTLQDSLLKSLLQHHSSKASILWHSAFFMVQLSHPLKTTGKTMALRTFASKVVCLQFNTVSRFSTALFPRSTSLLTSWLQSPSAGILEPKKGKSVTEMSMRWWTFTKPVAVIISQCM